MLKRSVNDTAIYKIKYPTISIHSRSPSHVIEITDDKLKNRFFFLLNHRFWYQNDSFKNLHLSYWLSDLRVASPAKQDFLRVAVRPTPGH